MSELEIEKEIQAKVEFKMNEFLTAVKNRLSFKYIQAFDMTIQSQYEWKAFEEVSEMIKKEIYMPTPYDNMVEIKKNKKRDIAVDKIVKILDIRDREYREKIRSIVSAIELAQDW